MTLLQALRLATWVGELVLGLVCLARSAREPLARPLAALCFVITGFTFAEWAWSVSRDRWWTDLDVTLSSLAMPVAMYFILAFVGARRRLRWLLVATAAPFVLLSLACASAFVSEWGKVFARSLLRGRIEGALILPAVATGLALLVRHERNHSDFQEKVRTRLVIAALLIGGLLGALDVFGATLPVPSMLVSTALLAIVVLRLPLFYREPMRLVVVYGVVVAMIGALAYYLSYELLGARDAVLVLALLGVTAGLVATIRQLVTSVGAQRARLERLTVLGRLSSQMAHDLKNPLSALKGAAQVLQAELEAGRPLEPQRHLMDLLVTESDRLARLIDRYQQLAHLEPEPAPLDVNALLRRVASLRAIGLTGTRIELALAAELPEPRADADLLETAVDNLVTNALEALDGQGRVELRSARSQLDAPGVVITVADDGPGMNARDREHALEELFTTKAGGSGLGLPFAQRVAEAHGGRLVLTSVEGAGTQVAMVIPLQPPPADPADATTGAGPFRPSVAPPARRGRP